MTKVPINEIFYSIQGEGPYTGYPTVFIRTMGCNLQCDFCDSKYSWNEGDGMTLEEIDEKVRSYDCNHICITGGEPTLLLSKLNPLLQEWWEEGWGLELETNGSNKIEFDHIFAEVNVSYKLSNAHNKPYELKALDQEYNYKFVVEKEEDIKEIQTLQEKHPDIERVFLMPEGMTKKEQEDKMSKAIDWCKEYGYVFCPRLHVLVWDSKRAV